MCAFQACSLEIAQSPLFLVDTFRMMRSSVNANVSLVSTTHVVEDMLLVT